MTPLRRSIAVLISILMLASLPLMAMAGLHIEAPAKAALFSVDDRAADDGHDESRQCGEEHCCTDLCSAALIPEEPGHIPAAHFYREPFHAGWQLSPPHPFYKPPCHLISS